MPIPTIKKKEQEQNNLVPKRKNLTVDSVSVDTFERCKTKYQQINTHLKEQNEEEISFHLEKDIDIAAASRSLVHRFSLNGVL